MKIYGDPQNEDEVSNYIKSQVKEFQEDNYLDETEHPDRVVCPCCGYKMHPSVLITAYYNAGYYASILGDESEREHEELKCFNCKSLITVEFEINIKTKRY